MKLEKFPSFKCGSVITTCPRCCSTSWTQRSCTALRRGRGSSFWDRPTLRETTPRASPASSSPRYKNQPPPRPQDSSWMAHPFSTPRPSLLFSSLYPSSFVTSITTSFFSSYSDRLLPFSSHPSLPLPILPPLPDLILLPSLLSSLCPSIRAVCNVLACLAVLSPWQQ